MSAKTGPFAGYAAFIVLVGFGYYLTAHPLTAEQWFGKDYQSLGWAVYCVIALVMVTGAAYADLKASTAEGDAVLAVILGGGKVILAGVLCAAGTILGYSADATLFKGIGYLLAALGGIGVVTTYVQMIQHSNVRVATVWVVLSTVWFAIIVLLILAMSKSSKKETG